MFSKPWVLSVILFVQIALVISVSSLKHDSAGNIRNTTALTSLDNVKIDRIIISDGSNKVELSRLEQGWILPGYYNLPVNTGTVTALIESIGKLQAKWPVAKTKEASERFQVTDKNYQRHINLFAGGKQVADLYLGKSPGYKKIYARMAGDLSIHTVRLGLHLAPATAQEWFDKGLLKIKNPVERISGSDFVLAKQDGNWQLADIKDQEKLNLPEIERLMNYLLHIQVAGVADTELVKKLVSSKPLQTFRLKSLDKSYLFEFYKKDEQVVIKSDQSDLYFTLPAYLAKNIENIMRKSFIQ